MQMPRFTEVEHKLYAKTVDGFAAAVCRAWGETGCRGRIGRGDRVGIAVGSRGISDLPTIVGLLVEVLKKVGAEPFIVPAMGSHGGATPQGQTAVLESLGITPQSVGAPIRASMATEELGQTENGIPVHSAGEALRADGVVLVNRIKQHTDFSGEYESGLVKMLAIGLGKREGATALHSRGCESLRSDVPQAARLLLKRLPVLGGLAILENGYHRVAEIVGLPAGRILSEEKRLLRRVRRNAARIPFDQVDLLLVDWIGKDISGVGLDTHVIARRMVWGEPEFRGAQIRVIAALDLTPGSKGNPLGVGLADLVSQRLIDKIDWHSLRTNVMHTGFLNRAKLPIPFASDRQLFQGALTALGDLAPARVRIVRIADTNHLGRLWVSDALLEDVRKSARLQPVGEPSPLKFDRTGNLRPLERQIV
jgi:hypothetical protein